jgi:hypothetical protein
MIFFLFYPAKILTTIFLFFFYIDYDKKELLNNYATTTIFIVNYYPHFTDEEHYHNHIHPLSLIYHPAVQPRNGHWKSTVMQTGRWALAADYGALSTSPWTFTSKCFLALSNVLTYSKCTWQNQNKPEQMCTPSWGLRSNRGRLSERAKGRMKTKSENVNGVLNK